MAQLTEEMVRGWLRRTDPDGPTNTCHINSTIWEEHQLCRAWLERAELRAALAARDEQITNLTHDRDSWREQADEMATEAAKYLERVRELESGDVLSERARLLHVAEERVAELEAGLRELYEAQKAVYPRFEDGAEAQRAWAERISAADARARALLAPPETRRPTHCPTCDSPAPHLHPAMQAEGEVQPCKDPWHIAPPETPAPDDECNCAPFDNVGGDQQLYVVAERPGCEGCFAPVCCIEDDMEDEAHRPSATRRAIVRAAAAIGQGMKPPEPTLPDSLSDEEHVRGLEGRAS